MKTVFTAIVLSLFVGLSAHAQQMQGHQQHSSHQSVEKNGHREGKFPSKEELQSQKIAFFTQELELTPEEAQRFWPVYNDASKKTQAAKKQINICLKNLHNALKAETPASDAEIKDLMGSYFKACEEEIAIQSKNFEEISKVLPVDKAAKTFSLEERFRIMLIRHLRK